MGQIVIVLHPIDVFGIVPVRFEVLFHFSEAFSSALFTYSKRTD